MKHAQAIVILVLLVSCSLVGHALAQSLSAPLDPLASSNWGTSVYLYNPATDSIVSPTGSNGGLIMIPWQYYDNTTMQWTITQFSASPLTFSISTVTPQAAGCPAGTTGHWNALKKAAVTVLCSPATSLYTSFVVLPGSSSSNFVLSPNANPASCVAVVNDVPTSPATVCNPLGQYTQWQLVNIA